MAQVTSGASAVANSDIDLDASPPLVRRLVAELFGTFLLVFGVIGTAMFSGGSVGLLGVSLAVGLAVIAGAYSVGHISGGHFNPAVSIGAAAAGRFAWREVLPYIGAQVVGGAIATTVLFAIRAGGPAEASGTFLGVSNGYDAHSPAGYNIASVLLAEVVLTALFVYVILGVTDRRAPSGFAPLAIGLALTLVHLMLIPISNASVNPARSIATAIYGGPESLGQLWAFIVAPIVGGLIAGFTYNLLFDRRRAA